MKSGLSTVAWLMAAVVPGFGQAGVPGYVPTLTFEVASVRESPPADSYRVTALFAPKSSSLTVLNNSLENLLRVAYGYEEFYQIVGVPESFRGAVFFNIQARGDAAADEKIAALPRSEVTLEQQHMLQGLLADRFKLKMHWETRKGDILNLVAKNAAKLAAGKPEAVNAETQKAWGDRGVPPLYQRGSSTTGFDFVGHGCTMERIVEMLASQFRRPVVDKTGLGGKYDFVLRYFGTREQPESERNPAEPLETAIQDQLGLKLEAAKGPVRVLVVDSVEKPSEN